MSWRCNASRSTSSNAAPALKPSGAGISLQPNALQALKRLGVDAQVVSSSGRQLSDFNFSNYRAQFGYLPSTVRHAHLVQVLAASLKSRYPHCRIQLGEEGTEFEQQKYHQVRVGRTSELVQGNNLLVRLIRNYVLPTLPKRFVDQQLGLRLSAGSCERQRGSGNGHCANQTPKVTPSAHCGERIVRGHGLGACAASTHTSILHRGSVLARAVRKLLIGTFLLSFPVLQKKRLAVNANHEIQCQYFSQEDLLGAGCLDLNLAMDATERAIQLFEEGDVIFPEKIVQIFNDETQERINCLPATFRGDKICGVKWVSVFPPNPAKYGVQNLSAVIILSEIEHGFPIAIMEGTLCSNMRVGAMGGLAAKYLARPDSKSIGFIGAGEQAKMHLIAMKTALPSLETCRVAAKTNQEEKHFIDQMRAILPSMNFEAADTNLEASVRGSDVVVTATSVQAPLLKADWIAEGAFYSHVGGWEDEYAVAKQSDKIVCDDWETVKHRTQTLSRMFQEGELTDSDIYCNLRDIVTGKLPGRQNDKERVYFNAVGLAYTDVAIAYAMYIRALESGLGQDLNIQREMIFEHQSLSEWARV